MTAPERPLLSVTVPGSVPPLIAAVTAGGALLLGNGVGDGLYWQHRVDGPAGLAVLRDFVAYAERTLAAGSETT